MWSKSSNPSRIFEDIMDNLICCKCKEHLIYPILHCELGHTFCKKCYKKGSSCSICGYPCKGSRNHHLERICDSLIHYRKFSKYGSNKAVTMDKKAQIILQKVNALLPCPFGPSCKFQGYKKQLIFHCLLLHGARNFFKTDVVQVKVSTIPGSQAVAFCEAYNETFIVFTDCDYCTIRFAVNNLASEITSRFKFVIRLANSFDKKKRKESVYDDALAVGDCVNGLMSKQFFSISSFNVAYSKSCQFCLQIVEY